MLILTPAYGRDYRSKKAVLADWEADLDFIIATFNSPWYGKPVNRSGLVGSETTVNIRYSSLRRVLVAEVGQ